MKKQLSSHTQTAKHIRQELKKAFPLVKFSVISDSYSGGDSVRISWTDGPTHDMVNELTNKYQYGHFNGMEDIYENTNRRNDIPQSKYVQRSREISDDIRQQVFAYLVKTHAGFENIKSIDESSDKLMKQWNVWCAREMINRIISKQDLTQGWKEVEGETL